MEERIKSEVLLAMKTARDNAEALTDGSVDDITQAILTAVAESLPEISHTDMLDMGEFDGFDTGWNAYRDEVLAQLGKEE